MKRLLFFICTLLFANVLSAQVIWQDIEFRIRMYDDAYLGYDEILGTAEVIDYHGNEANLYIPFYLTYEIGNPGFVSPWPPVTVIVTSIGDYAFWDCSSLTSVHINDGIDSIGYAAFYNCSSLTSITIGDSVTFIDDWAFGNCSSLTSIGIPFGVTSIGNSVFDSCVNLTSVSIGNSVTSIGNSAFYDCSSLISVSIPNSVTSIDDWAFGNCSSLTSVSIGNSVTSIGDFAFGWCSSLTSVTIGNSVTSIGERAFCSCSSLTSIDIPNSVTSIGMQAFSGCSNLTSITIPDNVTSIEYELFFGCSSLTSITIPNSVTSIGERAFHNCISLPSVIIPNSITFIGNGAFGLCSSLTSVTCLATNPPALGDNAFYYIGSPSTLYVPNGCGEAYINSSWAQYFNCIVELGSGDTFTNFNLNVEVNNEEWGHVEVDEGCGSATLTAVADNDCSDFWRWSDGDTNNPRVINGRSDTYLTAIFTDPVFDTTIHATIAQGETYLLNGHELSQSGVYSANVLSEAGCEIYLTLVLDVIATDNIGADYSSLSQTSLESLSLKPNPTKGLIEFGQRIDKVVVIDISGRRIESFFDANQINISHLPAGVYHLELQCGDETVVRKIVKE